MSCAWSWVIQFRRTSPLDGVAHPIDRIRHPEIMSATPLRCSGVFLQPDQQVIDLRRDARIEERLLRKELIYRRPLCPQLERTSARRVPRSPVISIG